MLGCYFLSVLRKESLEIIIFLKMLLLCILAGRWNLPIVFKLRVFHSLFIIGPLWKSVNSIVSTFNGANSFRSCLFELWSEKCVRVVILFPDGSKDSAGDLLVGIYEAEDRINGYGSIAN